MYGAYNRGMGGSLQKLLLNHESEINPAFKQAVGSDIKTYLASHETSILTFDNDITCPMNGYTDRADYYDRASSSHRIPSIKIPTFFLNSLDDPVVHKSAIDYDGINSNPNCFLGITKHGGHIGYR
jgi:predicted alpha/beta-fold hydrolase